MRFIVPWAAAAACSFGLVWQSCNAQDAAKLYQAYKEASAKIKTLTYTAEVASTAVGGSMALEPVTGKVVMTTDLPDRPDFRGKFHVVGQVRPKGSAPRLFEIGFNGKTVRNVIHDTKVVDEIIVPEGDEPIQFFEPPLMLLAFSYWHDEDEEQEPSAITLDGSDEIGGVKCDILIVERTFVSPSMDDEESENPAPPAPKDEKKEAEKKIVTKTRLHVGKEDHLLRKREYPEGPGKDNFVLAMTYTEVKPNPSLDATAFDVKTPDGYQVEVRKLDEGAPPPKFKVGDVAPDWTLKDADGKEHTLAGFKGKVVVMDFWATWCGYCKLAMPGLQKLHEKFKDKPVVIVGVDIRDEIEKAKKYMTSKKFTYLSLLEGDAVAEAYGVGPIPQFFVIGVDGKIIHYVVGFNKKNEKKLTDIIEKHLKEHSKD